MCDKCAGPMRHSHSSSTGIPSLMGAAHRLGPLDLPRPVPNRGHAKVMPRGPCLIPSADSAVAMNNIRNSQTHPLRIDAVPAGNAGGNIGLSFCPGKWGMGLSGVTWQRDLDADLDVVRAWDAQAVVTLVEAQELRLLRVPHLGAKVRQRGMTWIHLHIVDGRIPDSHRRRFMSNDPVQVTMKSQSPDDVLVYFADEHVTTGLPLTRISPGVVRIDAVPFLSRAHAGRPDSCASCASAWSGQPLSWCTSPPNGRPIAGTGKRLPTDEVQFVQAGVWVAEVVR